jgi:hypothetical protein
VTEWKTLYKSRAIQNDEMKQNHAYDMRKRNIFTLFLKALSVSTRVMSDGKLFHILAAAAGNARSPTVNKRVRGTISLELNADR